MEWWQIMGRRGGSPTVRRTLRADPFTVLLVTCPCLVRRGPSFYVLTGRYLQVISIPPSIFHGVLHLTFLSVSTVLHRIFGSGLVQVVVAMVTAVLLLIVNHWVLRWFVFLLVWRRTFCQNCLFCKVQEIMKKKLWKAVTWWARLTTFIHRKWNIKQRHNRCKINFMTVHYLFLLAIHLTMCGVAQYVSQLSRQIGFCFLLRFCSSHFHWRWPGHIPGSSRRDQNRRQCCTCSSCFSRCTRLRPWGDLTRTQLYPVNEDCQQRQVVSEHVIAFNNTIATDKHLTTHTVQ